MYFYVFLRDKSLFTWLPWDVIVYLYIKTHSSESQNQGGSNKRHSDGIEIYTYEYLRALKIENAITKEL